MSQLGFGRVVTTIASRRFCLRGVFVSCGCSYFSSLSFVLRIGASRRLLLQHRSIAADGRHNQITLLRLLTGSAVSRPYDCSQRADGLCDSRPARIGREFCEGNPARIGLDQRIDHKELVLLARLQTDGGDLQQVDQAERVDRNSGVARW